MTVNPELPGLNLAFAIQLARHAGAIHRKHFSPLGVPYTQKADNTPVTLADEEVQQMLATYIRADFPEVSLIAEEGSHIVVSASHEVIADELDGTLPFRCGIPLATFEITFNDNGVTKVAAIYAALPGQDLLFAAELGKGAFVNSQPLRVHKETLLRPGQVVMLDVTPSNPPGHFRLFEEFLKRGVLPMGLFSLGYMATRVALGHAPGLIWAGINKKVHDAPAPALILAEAGCTVTDGYGKELRFDGRTVNGMIAASTPELHAQLLDIYSTCNDA
jgi:myo-inositol-1(or 4)-monophosphatase